MLYNELWNYAFFGLRSTFAGFLGVLAFLAPLAVLQVALTVYDRPSAALLLLYVLWVVGYDVPWTYTLWRLNADPRR
jgi:translocator protein